MDALIEYADDTGTRDYTVCMCVYVCAYVSICVQM